MPDLWISGLPPGRGGGYNVKYHRAEALCVKAARVEDNLEPIPLISELTVHKKAMNLRLVADSVSSAALVTDKETYVLFWPR